MPRWMLAALVIAIGALLWAGLHSPTAITATALSGNGKVLCLPPPGVTDLDQPRQTDVDGDMPSFRLDEATVTPLAGFSIAARVLSREDYSLGTEADYSPTDLALGWGPMAKPDVYGKLDISQSGRWYRYSWGAEGPPIAEGEIVRSSANMHIIPANPEVARALAAIRAGQDIRLDGWLVKIETGNGWRWQSSLSREDSGDGACELIYACSIRAR